MITSASPRFVLCAAAILALGAGCVEPRAFPCTTNDACVLAGQRGLCEPAGYCSFDDDDCASRRRYGELAPEGISDDCVPPSPSRYTDEVLSDAPVAYWPLDDTNGTMIDRSGNGHDGTYEGDPALGAPGALSATGNVAVRFDGVDDAVAVEDAPALRLLGSFSIELWAMPTADLAMDEYRNMIGKGDDGGFEFYYYKWFDMLRPSLAHCCDPSAGLERAVDSDAVLSLDGFRHYVVTYDPPILTFYADGEARISPDGDMVVYPEGLVPTGPITIARQRAGSFHAAIVLDEIALYDHALSAERIAAHFAAR